MKKKVAISRYDVSSQVKRLINSLELRKARLESELADLSLLLTRLTGER